MKSGGGGGGATFLIMMFFRGVWGHAPHIFFWYYRALRLLLVQFEALSCSTFVADIPYEEIFS